MEETRFKLIKSVTVKNCVSVFFLQSGATLDEQNEAMSKVIDWCTVQYGAGKCDDNYEIGNFGWMYNRTFKAVAFQSYGDAFQFRLRWC